VRPLFFATPAAWRRWLAQNHARSKEVLVGFHKRASGKPSITWPESVDEALCYGWIDGIRRRLDDHSYTIRFTPRRIGSTWSLINVGRVQALTKLRRMRQAGTRAFKARSVKKTGVGSYEQRGTVAFSRPLERFFRARPEAWTFFTAQPPGYQRMATWWVVSAVKEETRHRRLERLVEQCLARSRFEAMGSAKKNPQTR